MSNRLQIDQLEAKIKVLAPASELVMPPTGWIRAVRLALGISMRQLADKLSITRQSVSEMEKREQEGTITIASLRDAAAALDMTLVYGLVPKDGTLDALIERKALELATKIVSRTSATMKLEDQANSPERIRKAIEERAQQLQYEMPKILWD